MTRGGGRRGCGPSRCPAGSRSSRSWGRPTRACRAASSSSAAEAKVVRVVDGETIVTDGPFAETKEQLGGIFVTDLPDLDEAIRLAALVPAGGVRHARDPAAHQSGERSARRGLCRGVAAVRRDPDPCPRRSRTRRGRGAGCLCDGARALAADRASPTTRAPGSSPPPATARSTGSVVSAFSPTRRPCSPGSSRCPRTRTR